MPPIANGLIVALAIAFASLAIGSCVRLTSLRGQAGATSASVEEMRKNSLTVWWILTIAFGCGILLGKPGLAILFCTASLLALREFFRIFRRRTTDAPLLSIALAIVCIGHYVALAFSTGLWSMWVFPLASFAVITISLLIISRTKDYLRMSAGYNWAAFLLVLGPSYAVATATLPAAAGHWSAGPAGWCLFLVVLTEVNDIAQALIGRIFGRHKIAPVISPGKTNEGLAGGFVVTTLLSVTLAPWLTTLPVNHSFWTSVLISVGAGAIISLGGFLGDVNMSGLKREAGVKDSSSLLPGMGGMIDRLDSLTFTAPGFYFYATTVIST